MLVKELNEGELIARFQSILPVGERTMIGIGDDCAQIAAPEGNFIVTTDIIVEDQHFHRYWSNPEQIGARIAAQNLSDIAGMGGHTSALVVTFAVTADTEVEWLMAVVQGIADRAHEAGAGVVGGDLSAGEKMVLSITAFGYCEGKPVTRDGARPGDVLAASGKHGLSNAGLDLLLGGHVDPDIRDDEGMGEFAEALNIYRAPRPPLETGPAAARTGATAMMDLSDGIAMDGGRMARASQVVIELDRTEIERHAEPLAKMADVCGKDPVQWVIGGGEDHGMLATFPADVELPEGFHRLGRVRACESAETPALLMDGHEVRGGWDHFKN